MKKFVKIASRILLTGFLIFAVVFIFKMVEAGTLTPSAAPAATMKTLQETYDSLVGTFDSSGITASSTSNAIAISRCIITRITGGSCPL